MGEAKTLVGWFTGSPDQTARSPTLGIGPDTIASPGGTWPDIRWSSSSEPSRLELESQVWYSVQSSI